MMSSKAVSAIEGVGPKHSESLKVAGVVTTDQLLDLGGSKKGRAGLSAQTQISESMILKWVNMADLFRVKGVAGQFAELLEASGVDTVKELKMRNAVNLQAKMKEINEERNLTRTVPGEATVQGWIDQAKELSPAVSH